MIELEYKGIGERSFCDVWVCLVYSAPKPAYGYYEGGSNTFRLIDGYIYYFVSDRYADSADMYDHDHFYIESGFRYDPVKHELRYYIPETNV